LIGGIEASYRQNTSVRRVICPIQEPNWESPKFKAEALPLVSNCSLLQRLFERERERERDEVAGGLEIIA
jgi:hypothetical protein